MRVSALVLRCFSFCTRLHSSGGVSTGRDSSSHSWASSEVQCWTLSTSFFFSSISSCVWVKSTCSHAFIVKHEATRTRNTLNFLAQSTSVPICTIRTFVEQNKEIIMWTSLFLYVASYRTKKVWSFVLVESLSSSMLLQSACMLHTKQTVPYLKLNAYFATLLAVEKVRSLGRWLGTATDIRALVSMAQPNQFPMEIHVSLRLVRTVPGASPQGGC